ncbi:MAG: hypothetical protein K8U57_28825 [Planctomycetes bacterium]|nr:hypothetical protein [Planctomycetota bacterium]
MANVVVGLNGFQVWGFVVENDGDGVQVRLALDDWIRMDFGVGQRIPVRLPDRDEVLLFVTHVTESPPIVWITLAQQVPVVAVRAERRTCDQAQPESAVAYRPA